MRSLAAAGAAAVLACAALAGVTIAHATTLDVEGGVVQVFVETEVDPFVGEPSEPEPDGADTPGPVTEQEGRTAPSSGEGVDDPAASPDTGTDGPSDEGSGGDEPGAGSDDAPGVAGSGSESSQGSTPVDETDPEEAP